MNESQMKRMKEIFVKEGSNNAFVYWIAIAIHHHHPSTIAEAAWNAALECAAWKNLTSGRSGK